LTLCIAICYPKTKHDSYGIFRSIFNCHIIKEGEMNRAELIAKMAADAGISKAAAERALGAFVDGVAGALKGGGKVSLVGFGTFSVSDRAARVGRNPRTGANINIPASKVPKFKAGKGLKDAIK
jgi:DNA-binding protein HU-beta